MWSTTSVGKILENSSGSNAQILSRNGICSDVPLLRLVEMAMNCAPAVATSPWVTGIELSAAWEASPRPARRWSAPYIQSVSAGWSLPVGVEPLTKPWKLPVKAD